MEIKDPGETVLISKMIWIRTVCCCSKPLFAWRCPIDAHQKKIYAECMHITGVKKIAHGEAYFIIDPCYNIYIQSRQFNASNVKTKSQVQEDILCIIWAVVKIQTVYLAWEDPVETKYEVNRKLHHTFQTYHFVCQTKTNEEYEIWLLKCHTV